MERDWETDILPARTSGYEASWLDSLLLESELSWFGCGRKKVSFCFASDFNLFVRPIGASEPDELLDRIKEQCRGGFGYRELKTLCSLSARELEQELDRLIWEGKISSVFYQVVRRALLTGAFAKEQKIKNRGRDRWNRIHPAGERFYLVGGTDRNQKDFDIIDQEELNRDRVRQLLLRYGVLFRDILESELPHMRWSELFRTLRIMELSGEIVSGYYFEGISGVQFCPVSLLSLLRVYEPVDELYWMNACDPASLCGVGIDGLFYDLPPRIPSTHLVFHGTNLVLISRARGKKIDIFVPPDSPVLPQYLDLFRGMTRREYQPIGSIRVDVVNGTPVHKSPYLEALLSFGFKRLPSSIVLHAYQS